MAFPRVIHKGLGVYWGVSHCNSGHSMSQAARVALVFGITSLCIYLHYRSYTKTLTSSTCPQVSPIVGVALSTGSFYIPNYNICWNGLGVDICQVICVDMLHGLHKFIHDHVLLWIQRMIGRIALDWHLQAQIYHSGWHTFNLGVSKLTQMAGRENQELECLLVTIAEAEDEEGESLDPHFFCHNSSTYGLYMVCADAWAHRYFTCSHEKWFGSLPHLKKCLHWKWCL